MLKLPTVLHIAKWATLCRASAHCVTLLFFSHTVSVLYLVYTHCDSSLTIGGTWQWYQIWQFIKAIMTSFVIVRGFIISTTHFGWPCIYPSWVPLCHTFAHYFLMYGSFYFQGCCCHIELQLQAHYSFSCALIEFATLVDLFSPIKKLVLLPPHGPV